MPKHNPVSLSGSWEKPGLSLITSRLAKTSHVIDEEKAFTVIYRVSVVKMSKDYNVSAGAREMVHNNADGVDVEWIKRCFGNLHAKSYRRSGKTTFLASVSDKDCREIKPEWDQDLDSRSSRLDPELPVYRISVCFAIRMHIDGHFRWASPTIQNCEYHSGEWSFQSLGNELRHLDEPEYGLTLHTCSKTSNMVEQNIAHLWMTAMWSMSLGLKV
ncbi:hypothetical protein T265_09379 [Opisthorchis viverrini]|uniref:Uncharacterized protein n=1 Tax=Opisthorchis viverrini TaxID=6198 RepID=A0A075A549_OPIVI|nr:hypothetical protein T265_09379 [Opisthorchis viverrini]KER22549.1 hypothetical protein T265_09379 [Opisthorchis viverrini]